MCPIVTDRPPVPSGHGDWRAFTTRVTAGLFDLS